MAVDNFTVGALVDGAPVPFTTVGGFTMFVPFALSGPVAAAGPHTLAFRVQNGVPTEFFPTGPTGLRVEFESAEYIPEPSSIVLACLGAAGLGLLSLGRQCTSR